MRVLGKYRLVHEIARGGMGVVHLAVVDGPHAFRKLQVVKELLPEVASDPSFVAMFLEEARLAARLSHPNVVQTHEVHSEGGLHFMVIEFLDGRPLSRVLNARLPGFTREVHLWSLVSVLRGLAYAHELTDYSGAPLSIVHRDISPSNVFLTFDGQVKVIDFGIAKSAYSENKTKTGTFKGKPTYAAPEQVLGRTDARSDVFAVGVMLWEALLRRRMWKRATEIEVVARLLKGEVPSVAKEAAELGKKLSPELCRICDRALAVDPDERYPSATAFADDLERALMALQPGASLSQELAKAMQAGFGEERRAMYAELDKVGHAPLSTAEVQAINSAFLPSEEGQRISLTPSISQVAVPTDLSRSSPAVPALLPAASSAPGLHTSELPTRLTASTSVDEPYPAPKRRGVVALSIGAVALLGLGGAAVAVSQWNGTPKETGQPAAVHSTERAAVQPTETFPARAPLLSLAMQVSPMDAEVSVGKDLVPKRNGHETGSREISCREGEELTISASANGYRSQTIRAVCKSTGLPNIRLEAVKGNASISTGQKPSVSPAAKATGAADIRLER
jgi:eukaryotic-like serine/threonine-protein kinase